MRLIPRAFPNRQKKSIGKPQGVWLALFFSLMLFVFTAIVAVQTWP